METMVIVPTEATGATINNNMVDMVDMMDMVEMVDMVDTEDGEAIKALIVTC